VRPGKEVTEGMEGTQDTEDNVVRGMNVMEGPTETVMEVGNGDETGKEKKMEVENPQVDWTALWAEFTMDQLWVKRTWKCIAQVFAIGFFIRLLPGSVDLGTDGVSAKKFISGTHYTKYGTNLTELMPNNIDCSHIGRFTQFTEEGPEIVYEQVQCFERDPIWGIFTATCIFLPGCFAPQFLGYPSRWESKLLYYTLWLLSIPLFPLLVISVRLVGLINPGPEWKKLARNISATEGSYESTLQFLLQTFIIFSRGDRQPSAVQLATLTASLFALINIGIDDYMRAYPPKDLKEELSRKKTLLPVFLTSNIFKLGSVALLAATLKYWFVLSYIVPWIVLAIIVCFKDLEHLTILFLLHPLGLRIYHDPSWTKKKKMENCLFCNVYWFLCFSIFLIALTILANYNPDFSLLSHNLSSIAIVKNISLLNTIFSVVMVSGVISLGLIYQEYEKARVEEEEMERRSSTEESYEKDAQE
jgi:hypothetical protein